MKEEYSYQIASNLLEIGAIKFNFKEPFTWTSGIKSPIYCDNRLSLSYVELRNQIRDAYKQAIMENFPEVEVIAGVATGAIAQGALVADKLGLSFVYVRNKAKDCGMKKSVEGIITEGQKTVILEDLVSTGGSSIKVLEELRNEGANILGMVATLSYELPIAEKIFKEKNCKLFTLSGFSTLINVALEKEYVTKEQVEELYKWHQDPEGFYE